MAPWSVLTGSQNIGRNTACSRPSRSVTWRTLGPARDDVQRAALECADAQEQLRVVRLREAAGKAIDIEVLDALSVAASAREN